MNITAHALNHPHGIFHYYTRCIGGATQLFLFGSGLGDTAIIFQVADSFNRYIKMFGDPELGIVVISLGSGETSKLAMKGDWNLYWIGNVKRNFEHLVSHQLPELLVKPDIILCPSKRIVETVDAVGYETLLLPFGVGDEFKPLNLPREGLGYAGVYRDTAETETVLKPFLNHNRFEWIAKTQRESISLVELNEWYNRKQVVFGLSPPICYEWGILGNRIFETLASGTPLVTNSPHPTVETLGFQYPYVAGSPDKIVELVDYILENFDEVLHKVGEYSKLVREEHNYVVRLKTLFKFLKEYKK